jgi:hypothetical protein
MHLGFRHILFALSVVMVGGLISCGDDVDIPKTPLEGLIEGQEWSFKFGNAYPEIAGQIPKYKFLLLSNEEFGDDPCPIRTSTKKHVRMILPLGTGSYSIPFSNFNESVKFDMGDGRVFSATSGFIEIFGVDQNQLVGYIQAVLDEDNIVEGRFVVEIC